MKLREAREVTEVSGRGIFNRELEIAELLYQRKSYNQIAKALKVSPKTISQVRKKVEAGVIKIGEDGKASYVKGKQVSLLKPPEHLHNEELVKLEYGLMRVLGCSSPEEALKVANEFAVKLNPYQLYYNAKTPAQLVAYFESRIRELERELEKLQNQDEVQLAKRLGVHPATIGCYYGFKKATSYPGTLGDFLNTCVATVFLTLGVDLKEILSDYVDFEEFHIRKPTFSRA